jgi:hypothetical protein
MNTSRLIATALTLAFVGVLGGCSSTPSWDPTDLMDFLDTKKPTPGVRKPVFPEGVPGMTQGVPRELIKGSAEANAAADPTAAAPPPVEAQPAPPPAKRTRTTSRAKQPAQAPVEIAPDDVNVGEEPQPQRRQTSRPRATQPQQPVEQQRSPSPFPAPLPR